MILSENNDKLHKYALNAKQKPDHLDLISMSSDMICAMLSNGSLEHDAIDTTFISSYNQLKSAVDSLSIETSVSLDPKKVVCLICGAKVVILKKHLKKHGLTLDQYKEIYGAKVATIPTAYSEERRKLATDLQLGKKDRFKKVAIASK